MNKISSSMMEARVAGRTAAWVGARFGAVLLLGLNACRPVSDRQPPPGETPARRRVVSIAPSLTEIVCAVGAADRLVGRTDACNFPPEETARVPIVGRFGRPFMEALLAQHPTDVLVVDLEDPSIGALFQRLGMAYHRIPCRTLADIPFAIRQVGQIVQADAQAQVLADTLAADLAERRTAMLSIPEDRRPLVFVAVWWHPLMTVGRDGFISEIVSLAGGRNLGDQLERDFSAISLEWVLARDPDAIISLTPGARGSERERLAGLVGWRDLRAVRNGRVLDGFNLDILSRPGPRVIEAIDALRLALDTNVRPAD